MQWGDCKASNHFTYVGPAYLSCMYCSGLANCILQFSVLDFSDS